MNRPNGFGTVYRRGHYWTAKVRKKGPYGFISKSRSGFLTKREALLAIPELMESLTTGPTLEDSTTFAGVYERWVPFYSGRVTKGEMDSARAAFGHFKTIHAYRFADVTTGQMQACLDACPRGKRTKENMVLLCHRLYAYAIGERLVSVDYSEHLFSGKEERGTRPPFTPDEIILIDQAERAGVPYADYVLVSIYTGFRPTEWLSLTSVDYDPELNVITAGIKTEAGKKRTVPVHERIRGIIERRASAGGALFPDEHGRMMSEETFRVRYFRPLMDALGISGRVPYSARHAFANLLKGVKGADKDKAALLGHSDYAQTKYYQSAELDGLRCIIAGVPTVSTHRQKIPKLGEISVGSGPKGRGFKSRRPDQKEPE